MFAQKSVIFRVIFLLPHTHTLLPPPTHTKNISKYSLNLCQQNKNQFFAFLFRFLLPFKSIYNSFNFFSSHNHLWFFFIVPVFLLLFFFCFILKLKILLAPPLFPPRRFFFPLHSRLCIDFLFSTNFFST